MLQEPSKTTGPVLPPTGGSLSTSVRTAGTRACPACGEAVNVNASVCPNCGEGLPPLTKKIRCRACHRRAPAQLVVCPHCGRNLKPAASRWLTWGVPLLVLLLMIGIVAARASRGDPVAWVQARIATVQQALDNLGGQLQPEVSVMMVPADQDVDESVLQQIIQVTPATEANADAVTPATVGTQATALPPEVQPAEAAPVLAPTEPAAAAAPPTATASPTPAPATPTTVPTSSPTAQATVAPTTPVSVTAVLTEPAAALITTTTGSASAAGAGATKAAATQDLTTTAPVSPTQVAVATPASTVAITTGAAIAGTLNDLLPTPTPPVAPVQLYKVRPGDTVFDIALRYNLSEDELLAANQLSPEDAFVLQPGQELIIPSPTVEAAAAATPTPTPASPSYTVRAGDTLVAIALRLGLTTEELLDANNMTIGEARTLRPGQVLLLPEQESEAAAAEPTATAVPTNQFRLSAPTLVGPANNGVLSCAQQSDLSWQPVPEAQPDDVYAVHLGYVSAIEGGLEEVVWVVNQQRPISLTSLPLDTTLCGLAPAAAGSQWRWYVEVAEKSAAGANLVSPPSPTWGFRWQ